MKTINQDYTSYITSLEQLCDSLQNKFIKVQNTTSQNSIVVNRNLVIINAKITKLDDLQYQLSTFISTFKVMHSHEQPKGEKSFHTMGLNSNPFVRDLCLLKVDVNKFDDFDPTGWVTQMEHYFSLLGTMADLMKLHIVVLYLYRERWKWW
jgi:hypothetical protein